jgi:hypothetical protein
MTYNPSRFLNGKATGSDEKVQSQPNPALYAFGFGRRCVTIELEHLKAAFV